MSVKLPFHHFPKGGNLVDLSALTKYFGGMSFQMCCGQNNNPHRINEQLGMRSDVPNQKSICSPWLQNNTIKTLSQNPQTYSVSLSFLHTNKHTGCDITHIWMQDWLTPHSSFQCVPIFPFLPPATLSLLLPVCLSVWLAGWLSLRPRSQR